MKKLTLLILIPLFFIGELNAQSRDIGNTNVVFNNSNQKAAEEKNRIWLNLTDDKGAFNQILIGYTEEATNDIDYGYDSEVFFESAISFYSIQSGKNLVIQGRGLPFSDRDMVNLGYKITNANLYTISIDHLDGLFETQNIYLEDKLFNVLYDIKHNYYSFRSEAGIFNDRFAIRYTNNALTTNNQNKNDFGAKALILNQKLLVTASENIKSIEVFDLTGKLIKSYKPNAAQQEFKDDFLYANGMYIAKVKLANDYSIPIKLISKN